MSLKEGLDTVCVSLAFQFKVVYVFFNAKKLPFFLLPDRGATAVF